MTTSSSGMSAIPQQRERQRTTETGDVRWLGLYRTGGAAGLLIAALIPLATAAFIAWPPPAYDGPALEWLKLFQDNWLRGLLGLDLLFLCVWALQIPIFLSLYASLRRAGESTMALATTLALVATATYFASNPAFEMLSLSDRYASATTEAQRAMYLAAGQAVLAGFQGTAFKVSYVLASMAGVLFAVVILRSGTYSRWTGYARLLASVLGLGLFLPAVGLALGLGSVLFEWCWYVLIGLGLFRAGREVQAEPVSPR